MLSRRQSQKQEASTQDFLEHSVLRAEDPHEAPLPPWGPGEQWRPRAGLCCLRQEEEPVAAVMGGQGLAAGSQEARPTFEVNRWLRQNLCRGSWASEGNRKAASSLQREARLQALATFSPFHSCTSSCPEDSSEEQVTPFQRLR